MSSIWLRSGIVAAISEARANRVAASPNGRAAARRARNAGAPSNHGAANEANSSSGRRSRAVTSRSSTPSAASVGRHRERREEQRDVVAPARVADAEFDADLREEGAILVGDVELEAVVADLERPFEEVADPAVGIGQDLGHSDRGGADVEPRQRD